MSVVGLIPAYDAEVTIGEVVRGTRAVIPSVLVLDDGSTDATAARARSAGAEVIRFERNRGKGAVLREGFARALREDARAVVTLDADGQHDPDEIPRLLETWEATKAALVIGSRVHLESEMLPARRFGNRFSRKAMSLFAGTEIPDGQSGFRLYDANLLRAIPLRGTRYEMESEVIVKAARAGRRIEFVPIRLRRAEGKATSHFRPWRDTARICTCVVFTRLFAPRCS